MIKAGKYPTLQLNDQHQPKEVPSTSAAAVSTETNSNTASSSRQRSRKVILIEDLPNIHHGPTREAFHQALATFINRPASTAPTPNLTSARSTPGTAAGAGSPNNVPVVLILSETTPRADDESWTAAGTSSGWRDREAATLDLRSVVPEDIRKSGGFNEIRYVPAHGSLDMA